jgi:hypothetical protein
MTEPNGGELDWEKGKIRGRWNELNAKENSIFDSKFE